MKVICSNKFSNSSFNSLTFFLFLKLLFIKKPTSIMTLKKFSRPINMKIFELQLRKFFKVGLIKNSSFEKKLFHIRLNIKHDIVKNLYRMRLLFPEARKNFFEFYHFSKKILKARKPVLKFHENEIFFPSMCKGIPLQTLPSIQKLIVLKKLKTIGQNNSNKNMIKYHSYPEFIFITFFAKIKIILKCIKKFFPIFFFKSIQVQKGYYQLFEKKHYNLNEFLDLSFESSFENIVFLFQNFKDFNLKLTHCVESYENNFGLFLLYELCNIFTPRISDKIFFRPSRLYFFGGRRKIKKSSLSRKFAFQQNKSLKIVVESNFKIYVYKKRETKNDILQQFSDMLYKLPNFYVGDITARSINKAFKNRISGNNILTFIQNNLHFMCKKIPHNVIEQIKIWEFEKKNNFICKIVFASNFPKIWPVNFRHHFENSIIKKQKEGKKILAFTN